MEEQKVKCPACGGELEKRKNKGAGVKHCKNCGCGWLIIRTSQPKQEV